MRQDPSLTPSGTSLTLPPSSASVVPLPSLTHSTDVDTFEFLDHIAAKITEKFFANAPKL